MSESLSATTYLLERFSEIEEAVKRTESEQKQDPSLEAAALVKKLLGEEKLSKEHCEAAIAEIDVTLAAQTNEVLHNSEFQRLESAWRGLRYVVENTDFRAGIKIDLLDVSKDDLIEDLEETPDITLVELCRYLSEHGIAASTSSLWRFFRRHGITRKKRPATLSSRTARTS